MALSEYVGETPRDRDGAVIDRITRHHRWDVHDDAVATCPSCGSRLPLHERHLLATVSGGSVSAPEDRHYLCDEACLRAWVGE